MLGAGVAPKAEVAGAAELPKAEGVAAGAAVPKAEVVAGVVVWALPKAELPKAAVPVAGVEPNADVAGLSVLAVANGDDDVDAAPKADVVAGFAVVESPKADLPKAELPKAEVVVADESFPKAELPNAEVVVVLPNGDAAFSVVSPKAETGFSVLLFGLSTSAAVYGGELEAKCGHKSERRRQIVDLSKQQSEKNSFFKKKEEK